MDRFLAILRADMLLLPSSRFYNKQYKYHDCGTTTYNSHDSWRSSENTFIVMNMSVLSTWVLVTVTSYNIIVNLRLFKANMVHIYDSKFMRNVKKFLRNENKTIKEGLTKPTRSKV